MADVDWTLPILDIVAIILAIISIVISILIAIGIVKSHDKISDIHGNLPDYTTKDDLCKCIKEAIAELKMQV